MERKEVLSRVEEVFRDVLDNEEIVLNEETVPATDVEDYDSLSHVQIVVAIQREFGIKFTAAEIQSWNNVKELIDCILNK